MDAAALSSMRERVKQVTVQVEELKSAEELVEFFNRVKTLIAGNDGILIKFSKTAATVASYANNGNMSSVRPLYGSDKREKLWPGFLEELAVKMHEEVTPLLQKYTERAVAARDAALCGICGSDPDTEADTRQLRGVHLREKQDGDPEVPE